MGPVWSSRSRWTWKLQILYSLSETQASCCSSLSHLQNLRYGNGSSLSLCTWASSLYSFLLSQAMSFNDFALFTQFLQGYWWFWKEFRLHMRGSLSCSFRHRTLLSTLWIGMESYPLTLEKESITLCFAKLSSIRTSESSSNQCAIVFACEIVWEFILACFALTWHGVVLNDSYLPLLLKNVLYFLSWLFFYSSILVNWDRSQW